MKLIDDESTPFPFTGTRRTPPRRPISMDDSILSVLEIMCEGNPGAGVALAQLMTDPIGLIDVLHLDDMNMRGPQIWVGYKHCEQNVERFRQAIRDRSEAMVAAVNLRCEPQMGERARTHAP